ncbi:MAG TPA: hypothetical protein VFU82_01135 [Gammaproteobacteria bacterium]|jgi:hypothetical protein|nr:hypothetical protein [Gammaproteobacteria bacterium]
MQSVLNHILAQIQAATIDPLPSENFYIDNLFSDEVYAEILAKLPTDEQLDFIEHPDAVTPDGRKTRKLIDLTEASIARFNPESQAFWRSMREMLSSEALQKAILTKFKTRIDERFGKEWPELVTVPIFYRDFPGYRISEHTDAPYKVATMQFYFPADYSQLHLGTSFHLRENGKFKDFKTNVFKPKSAYAFVRTDQSWHSVKMLGENESARNTLALTIYEKGKEYQSSKIYT